MISGEDGNQFNNMINELLRMNYHDIKTGSKNGKQRANSEKTE